MPRRELMTKLGKELEGKERQRREKEVVQSHRAEAGIEPWPPNAWPSVHYSMLPSPPLLCQMAVKCRCRTPSTETPAQAENTSCRYKCLLCARMGISYLSPWPFPTLPLTDWSLLKPASVLQDPSALQLTLSDADTLMAQPRHNS